MAKQTINIGSSANDGTGTSLRDGGDLINDNFNEIYTAIGDGTTITTGTFVTETGTHTLTNKTIALGSNTISGTTAQFNSALSDGSFVTLAGTETLTNKTLTSPVINSPTGDFIKIEGTDFTNSILIGHSTTGTLSSAQKNTGVGIEALDALTSGDQNNALGYKALTNVNSGGRNTGIGHRTGENLTQGSFNTYVGDDASRKNVTGSYNSSYGANALEGVTNSSHSYNSAFGSESLKCVTTGDRNIGIGYQAGDNITTGSGSVIIGSVDADSATGDRQLKIAGYDGSTTTTWIKGDNTGQLTISGAYTLPASDGSANQVLQTDGSGTLSFADMTSGASSIDELSDAVANQGNINFGTNGIGSVYSSYTASNNIGIGNLTLQVMRYGSCNIAIGASTMRNGGTSASFQGNTAIGDQSAHCLGTNSTGAANNTFVGRKAGCTVTSGCNNLILGANTTPSSVTVSNEITLGDANVTSLRIPGLQSGATQYSVLAFNNNTDLALAQITSSNFDSAVCLQILDSSGSVLKTIYSPGS